MQMVNFPSGIPDCDSHSLAVLDGAERSTAKNCCPFSLLSVTSKLCETLVNNRIVDYLEKYDLFAEFRYGFRSSQSTTHLLIELLELLTGLGLLEL